MPTESESYETGSSETGSFESAEQDSNPQFEPQRPQPEPRRRPANEPDAVSIGAGLVFFLIGGAYLLASAGHVTVNAGWTLSMLLLGLGLSGVVGAVLRSRRRGGRDRP